MTATLNMEMAEDSDAKNRTNSRNNNGEVPEPSGRHGPSGEVETLQNQTSNSEDGRDIMADRFKNNIIIIGLTVVTTVNYIVPNVQLVRKYSEAAENDRFVRMTLSYMIAPIFITSLINLAWYIDDDLRDKDEGLPRTKRRTWWIRGVALVLQMGTVLRLSQALMYGYKSKRAVGSVKEKYDLKAACLERDGTLLKSFTSFMQGVPQFALQLYLLLQVETFDIHQEQVFWQLLSLGGSLLAIVWATATCDRILSANSVEKVKTDWLAMALLLPWRLFSIGSRLTILALFSTLFPVYFGLGCVAHYLVMFALIQRQKVSQHNERRGEVFLFLVGGLVFIITDLMVKYEHSFHKYIVYYSIALVEGSVMMVVWYVYAVDVDPFLKLLFGVGVLTSYVLGILFLRMLYEYNHSKAKNILCIKACCFSKVL